MARHIIPKDNGKFAVWSTITNDFVMDDLTREEVVDFFMSVGAQQARLDTENSLHNIERGVIYDTYEMCCEWRDGQYTSEDEPTK